MHIDYAFILAAGLGTRMGELGKILPKPLWPVFDKTLLELQLSYVKSLGIKKVFINTHHVGSLVEKKVHELGIKNLHISHENELQDIGGGIHRIAEKINYYGKMLVLNCDQFLWLTRDDLKEMNALLTDKNSVALTSIKVNPLLGYNGIKIKNHQFEGLLLGDDLKGKKQIDTFGGVSLLDLSRISPKPGRSKFFESIVSLDKKNAGVWNAEKREYWDFGTKNRFALSHWEIITKYREGTQNDFIDFLIQQGAFKPEKLKKNSYGCELMDTIQLSAMTIARDKNRDWEVFSPLLASKAVLLA